MNKKSKYGFLKMLFLLSLISGSVCAMKKHYKIKQYIKKQCNDDFLNKDDFLIGNNMTNVTNRKRSIYTLEEINNYLRDINKNLSFQLAERIDPRAFVLKLKGPLRKLIEMHINNNECDFKNNDIPIHDENEVELISHLFTI